MSEWRTDLPFAPVPMWVAELPISDRALRLYTILAGLRDYHTDQASFGRKLLAEKLHCSLDSLDRAKAELEEHAAISVKRGSNGTGRARNVYTVHRIPAASRSPAATQDRIPAATPSRSPAAMNEKKENEIKASPPLWNGPKSVGGKKVTRDEVVTATAILDSFNEVSGRRFSGKEWLTMIVRRMREHPDVALEGHQEIIRDQFERPWWKGDPSPAVIYSKGSVFDQALNGVGRRKKREPVYTRA